LKPLFFPLKTEYFDAFRDGTKTVEYRAYGPRWNERSCAVGREVVLSKGYGKQERLTGVIVSFEKKWLDSGDWIEVYGMPGTAACIEIRLSPSIGEKHGG
jgi:hypothetical protein